MAKQNIWIVALDGSAMDQNILRYTQFLANRTNPACIHFARIVPELPKSRFITDEAFDFEDQILKDSELAMSHQVGQFFDGETTTYECHVKTGAPFDELISLSIRFGADLVIAGRKKASSASGVISDNLSRSLPGDFLLVPEEASPTLDNILVATDFSDHSSLAMWRALELADEHSQIVTLNTYDVPMGYSKSGKSFEEFATIMQRNAERNMENWKGQFNRNSKSIFALDNGDGLAKQVLKTANHLQSNLIVMGSKGQTKASFVLLGSNTLKLVKENDHIPLLIVKKEGENIKLLDAIKSL